MKELNRELQSVLKSLKALSQKADKMVKTLDKLEKSQMGKKAKAKPMKKAPARRLVGSKEKKLTAADTILTIIKGAGKPLILLR